VSLAIPRGRPAGLIAGLFGGLAGASALALIGRRVLRELDAAVVEGRSMVPTLEPGDRLLVESWTYRRRAPRPGEVVLAADPRRPKRELAKRVAAVGPESLKLVGDGPRSTDSRAFGAIPLEKVRWRAIARYWPLRRVGRIPGPPPAAPRAVTG
jgi:nickel-type superoxide dismutase maturation protease